MYNIKIVTNTKEDHKAEIQNLGKRYFLLEKWWQLRFEPSYWKIGQTKKNAKNCKYILTKT